MKRSCKTVIRQTRTPEVRATNIMKLVCFLQVAIEKRDDKDIIPVKL